MEEERGAHVESVDDARVMQSVIRIVKARENELEASRPRHACSNLRCNPLNEGSLIRQGRLVGPAVTSNVYVCKLGATHVCSESACELYSDSGNGTTCPVSGMQHRTEVSSYSRTDARTWGGDTKKPAPKKTKKKKRPPSGPSNATAAQRMSDLGEETVKHASGEIVTRLLFGERRVRRNDAEISARKVRAEKRCDKYRRYMATQRQLPYESVLACIVAESTSRPLPLREYEYCEAMHNYYTDIVYQMWTHIVRYLGQDATATKRRHCDPETVCVSTLYSMRSGLTDAGRVMLPMDAFLRDNLPDVCDLATYFGIERSRLSHGSHMLTAALKYSLQTYGQATLRADLMAVATADDVKAFERAQGHARVPIKMSSSGETLFMPQSRRRKE